MGKSWIRKLYEKGSTLEIRAERGILRLADRIRKARRAGKRGHKR